jgi:Flp pilus assembly protein TadG
MAPHVTHGRDARGQALIEMAMVLPLLLLLIAGIVDFALLFQSYEVVTNAAREGARVAVLPGYTTADVEDRVASYITAAGLPGTPTTTVTPVTITPAGGGAPFAAVQVAVTYTHSYTVLAPMSALFGRTFPGSSTFTVNSTMRTEIQP